mmetsp:Transcript_6325/g.10336  ORF Transcript_6325/g.10336 Transcript_6325/m.10336 type:complete len:229 (+) Transcript_6325:133-819(+)
MHAEEPSLLDHLKECRSKVFQEGGVSFVIYAGTIKNEADMTEALSAHRKIVEDEVNNGGCNITGILIGQGNTIVHVLEGPCHAVLSVLKTLSQHAHFSPQAGAEALQHGRVVFNTEDRPERFYPEWYSCVIQERRSSVEEITAETAADVVLELAEGMITVGKGLRNDTTGELDFSRYSSHLPGKNLVVSMSLAEEFFTIKDFVGLFADEYHVELSSESSWPMQPLVMY